MKSGGLLETCLGSIRSGNDWDTRRGVMRLGRGVTVSFKGFNSGLGLCTDALGGSFPGGGVPGGEVFGGFLDNWEYSFFIVWEFSP